MIRDRRALYGFTVAFLIIELALGVCQQISFGGKFSLWAYGSVILAALFCALLFEPSLPYFFTQAALLLTVCADYFLVWREEQQKLPAMVFFLGAQIFYFLRLYTQDEGRTRRRVHLLARAGVSLVALLLTLLVLGEGADALALVSMLYYANLLMNLVWSSIYIRKHWLLSIGFLCFLLCDTLIGLSLLDGYLPIKEEGLLYAVLHPGFNLVWAFYLPSQVCLALSLLPERLNRKENQS